MVDLVALRRSARERDLTVYPVSEPLGEGIQHMRIVELLRQLVERWVAERGIRALVGSDQFFYYERGNTTARIAPDVYVLPGVDPKAEPEIFRKWVDRKVPSFAFESVSQNHWQKDYVDIVERYEALGVPEVIAFDPRRQEHDPELRIRFRVFRRVGKRLEQLVATDDDRVFSEALGCFLVAVGPPEAVRIRLGTGENGDDLYPSTEELAARASAAEAEIARLRALLEKKS
jgi:Uma2 family endonuclease